MISVSRRLFLAAFAVSAVGAPYLPVQAQDNSEETIYDNLTLEEGMKVSRYSLLVNTTIAKNKRRILQELHIAEAFSGLSKSFHPEHEIDVSPEQQVLFQSGKSLEFTQGFLYHGRSNLPQIILDGFMPKNSYVTRAPQTWALQPFVDLETDPAIFVIDAFDFNREVNAHRAALRLRKSNEIYPSFNENFPLDKVVLIFITLKDRKKYLKLIERFNTNPESLSQDEKRLAVKMKDLFDKGKIRSFDFSEHENLNTMSTEDRFLELRKELIISLHLHGLKEHLPRFQLQTSSSTKDSDHSPELFSEEDVNKKMVAMTKEMRELVKIIRENNPQIAAEAAERSDRYRLLGIGGLTISAALGGGWWIRQGMKNSETLKFQATPKPRSVTASKRRDK